MSLCRWKEGTKKEAIKGVDRDACDVEISERGAKWRGKRLQKQAHSTVTRGTKRDPGELGKGKKEESAGTGGEG